jgi:hypothetical protein
VYEPAGSPETVVLVPVPEVVTLPGVRVSVQVPLAGNPVITTLPVADEQVGSVMEPTTGVVGTSGCGSMSTGKVEPEVHPSAFVTVNVYDPADRPVTV